MTHDDGDPLLVRPFTVGERATADIASAETWPAATVRSNRAIKSHRAGPIALPGAPAEAGEPRRRRVRVLAVAGAAVVIALAAIGYAAFRPAEDGDFPVPSGALPPIVSSSAPPGPAVVPTPAAASTTRARTGGTTSATTAPAQRTAVGAPDRTTPQRTTPQTEATTTAAPPSGARSPDPTLSAPPAAARVGTIAADGNLCLDLNGGVPADDNHVQVFDCNGTVAQQWTLAPDGTLQVVGKCAQVTGDTTVHIIGCDSRETAQWRAGPGDALVNLATNQCLTDPAAGAQSGVGVKVAECTSAENQQWALPS